MAKKRIKGKKSIVEVIGIVDSEGLGYAVQDYLSHDDIADVDLADAWRRAKEALDEIDAILEVEMERLEDEDET